MEAGLKLLPKGTPGRSEFIKCRAKNEQLIAEILAKTARSQMVREVAVTFGWGQAETAETLAPSIHAVNPSTMNNFVTGAANPILKLAAKRSTNTTQNLSQVGKQSTPQSTPDRDHSRKSKRPDPVPICPHSFCGRAHRPPCNKACRSCKGKVQATGHPGACT